MNALKKYLGIVWMVLALIVAYYCIQVFGDKLISNNQDDLVFGGIVFFILLPMIVVGLFLFGYYAFTNEYKD
jgi:Na+/proline symporter